MPSSQEPIELADAPDAIQELALQNKGIVVNLRADKWPKEMVETCRGDTRWKINMLLHWGRLMSPWLTDFLNQARPGEIFVACVQDVGGQIFTLTGEIRDIYWLSKNSNGKGSRGVHAAIRTVKTSYKHGLTGWQIWGNYVLAIACLSGPVKSTSTPDPDGKKFINFVNKYGTRK